MLPDSDQIRVNINTTCWIGESMVSGLRIIMPARFAKSPELLALLRKAVAEYLGIQLKDSRGADTSGILVTVERRPNMTVVSLQISKDLWKPTNQQLDKMWYMELRLKLERTIEKYENVFLIRRALLYACIAMVSTSICCLLWLRWLLPGSFLDQLVSVLMIVVGAGVIASIAGYAFFRPLSYPALD